MKLSAFNLFLHWICKKGGERKVLLSGCDAMVNGFSQIFLLESFKSSFEEGAEKPRWRGENLGNFFNLNPDTVTNKAMLPHTVSTFWHIRFQFLNRNISDQNSMHWAFTLVIKKRTWFNPHGSENACVLCMHKRNVAMRLNNHVFHKLWPLRINASHIYLQT